MPHSEKSPTTAHRIQFVGYHLLTRTVTLLPHGVAMWIAMIIMSLAYYIAPVRKKYVIQNLEIAFGKSISTQEKKRLAKAAFQNLGMLAIDSIFISRKGADWAHSRITEKSGQEILQSFEARKQNFVAISGHIGSWELLGASAQHLIKMPVNVLSKPMHNPLIQNELESSRGGYGTRTVWTDDPRVTRTILQKLRDGEVMTFLSDQDMRMEGIFVKFFDRPASTTAGPAFFALKLGLPIVPAFLIRLGPTHHRFVVKQPIDPADAEGETNEEKIWWLTQEITRTIEDVVREYPAQFFWFHRRWKTTPLAYEKRKRTLDERRRQKTQKSVEKHDQGTE